RFEGAPAPRDLETGHPYDSARATPVPSDGRSVRRDGCRPGSAPRQYRIDWRGMMKYLLTSAGIRNANIHSALVERMGKPIAECDALCIPTAMYGHPWVGPGTLAWNFISGREPENPMCELGWKSVGVLELTALPSIDKEKWVPLVRETEVLLVSGGDA